MSTVFETIKSLLDAAGVPYRVIEHEPVYTSEEAARVRGTELRQGAKAMVFAADGRAVLLVVAAHRRISTKRFKRRYKVKDLRLMDPGDVTSLTGLTVGSIPPFGNVLELPAYVDRSLLESSEIAFNPGSHTNTIVVSCDDYLRVAAPEIGEFSA